MCEIEGLDRYVADFVMEGGAIHTDGEGTLLVTEQCLLNPNRNPHLDKAQIEKLLCAWLGVTTVIWLGDGVIEDETDGHVDNLACFAAPGEVCLTWTDNARDPQHRVSADALERLKAARDAKGRRLKVHKLPSPGPLKMTKEEAEGVLLVSSAKHRRAGDRLAGSYANFYLCNGGVVVPLLDPRTDAAAIAKLKRIFPKRRVVGVPGREILLGGGNIHCITQQIPAARARDRAVIACPHRPPCSACPRYGEPGISVPARVSLEALADARRPWRPSDDLRPRAGVPHPGAPRDSRPTGRAQARPVRAGNAPARHGAGVPHPSPAHQRGRGRSAPCARRFARAAVLGRCAARYRALPADRRRAVVAQRAGGAGRQLRDFGPDGGGP